MHLAHIKYIFYYRYALYYYFLYFGFSEYYWLVISKCTFFVACFSNHYLSTSSHPVSFEKEMYNCGFSKSRVVVCAGWYIEAGSFKL